MNGAHDSTFGCKFQSNDFIKSLTPNDINILTETWGCSHEFDIPQLEKKVILHFFFIVNGENTLHLGRILSRR